VLEKPSGGCCARIPITPRWRLVLQTLTVAQRSLDLSALVTAARIWPGVGPGADVAATAGGALSIPTATATAAMASGLDIPGKISTSVMDFSIVRSEGVTETLTASASTTEGTSWERFEALYRSSRDDLYAYVCTLLRDRAAAEDVTALAFERAYRRRRTFDRRRGEERAWLFGIARNAALDELRRRRRVAALVSDPSEVTEREQGGGEEEVALRRTAVQSALAKLPAREREIVALKFHAGMSNPEMARVLGISESNAGTLLYRTMEKLRKACNATA
jgi:RNA polymerase sigma-70 factor, ECF subfamily